MRSLFIALAITTFPSALHAQTDLEKKLAEAQAAYDADSANADAIVWLGRRLAYVGRYRDAIDGRST